MINQKIIIFLLLVFLSACESFKTAGKVLRNEKISNTDEFLVQKKTPLIEPPNLNEIPIPESIKKAEQNTKKNLGELKIQSKISSKIHHILISIFIDFSRFWKPSWHQHPRKIDQTSIRKSDPTSDRFLDRFLTDLGSNLAPRSPSDPPLGAQEGPTGTQVGTSWAQMGRT